MQLWFHLGICNPESTVSELTAIYHDLLPPLGCNASASDSFSVNNRKQLKCHISLAEPRNGSSKLAVKSSRGRGQAKGCWPQDGTNDLCVTRQLHSSPADPIIRSRIETHFKRRINVSNLQVLEAFPSAPHQRNTNSLLQPNHPHRKPRALNRAISVRTSAAKRLTRGRKSDYHRLDANLTEVS